MFENTVKCVAGLLALGCLVVLTTTAGAAVTETKNSADFDWRYEMDVEPSEANLDGNLVMDFTKVGSGTVSIENGILEMISSTNSFNYVSDGSDQIWNLDPNITYANGYTYEVRLKAIGSKPMGFTFFAVPDDDTPGAWLNVAPGGQTWGPTGSPLGEANNNDDFHVFRVAQAPGETVYNVWRDGVLLSDSLGAGYSSPGYPAKVVIGDTGENWGTVMEIDYLRFTSGAYAPGGTSPPIPGDANLDRVVDDKDASILAAHWQYGSDATWADGDFNGDGYVNDEDASILAAHWQESQESAASVPEPSVLVLLGGIGLLGLVGLARRRR
jgi:hypothetical protein